MRGWPWEGAAVFGRLYRNSYLGQRETLLFRPVGVVSEEGRKQAGGESEWGTRARARARCTWSDPYDRRIEWGHDMVHTTAP